MTDNKKNNEESKIRTAKFLRYFGIIMASIEIIAAIVFIGFLFWSSLIPLKYEIVAIIVMLLLSALTMYLQFTKVHWVGKVLACILTIVLILGDVYIAQAKSAISSISGSDTKTDVISVYVLKEDSADTIEDARDYKFGYHETLDQDNTQNTISKINESLGTDIKTETYTDLVEMVDALYNKDVDAIILNESYVSSLDEAYPDFAEETKIIDQSSYQTLLKPRIDKNTLTDCFTIYLSGNDETGTLNKMGRSDVNILIVVNPKTKQILLINTPRDYYVKVNSLTSGTGKDKLTHAGQFGVDASMETLSSLYDDWDIDYFVRVNFTGVEGIVDALGGVTVNSDISFTTSPDTSEEEYTFVEGSNKLNGKKALAYCRERQSVAGGDNQRGKDQMAVISAIIDKVASPSILYNYSSVLDSVSSLFQTNLDDEDIASMVKLTMDDPTGWNVQNYAVTGTNSNASSYFFGYSSMYVMEPDKKSVETAVELMNKVKNGETFNVDEYVNSDN